MYILKSVTEEQQPDTEMVKIKGVIDNIQPQNVAFHLPPFHRIHVANSVTV